MNVQDRLVALHDLDCPWRPGDLEQRYMELKNCLLMKEKFERVRLR